LSDALLGFWYLPMRLKDIGGGLIARAFWAALNWTSISHKATLNLPLPLDRGVNLLCPMLGGANGVWIQKFFSFPYCSLCLIVERRLKEYYNL
jgi:hypothetical protein